ncbi:MAG: PIN domain-containing protein [Chloroflexi bacterium]|nr:PIN domain-containing protein [Chloroflexota bacterium]
MDTSVVVRYIAGIPEDQADVAAYLIDHSDSLIVSGVVLVETAFVLRSVYSVPREEIVDGLVSFVRKDNIETYGMDKGLVLQGLLMCRPSGRVSFGDALIWAEARSGGGDTVYSFDQRFPSDGIEVRAGL